MDKITKFLLKLSPQERNMLLKIIEQIIKNQLHDLDTKKLIGEKNLYRVQSGKFRIICEKKGKHLSIINIDFRGNIYKNI